MSGRKFFASTIEIAAEPPVIFAILANPHRHPEIDGSGTLNADIEGPERLKLGDSFTVQVTQRRRFSYETINTVIEFEENRRIAWKHKGPQIWRYELEPAGQGTTRVTETFDYSRYGPIAFIIGFLFRKNRESMDETLRRLKEIAEAA